MTEIRGACKVLVGLLRERNNLVDLNADRIILKLILEELIGMAWTELMWLSIGASGGLLLERY